MKVIFDLDLTLINSAIAEANRKKRDWKSVYTQIRTFTEYEGMRDVLNYLDQFDITYSIVTSSPAPYCQKVCSHWKFRQDHLVTFYDTVNRKPHPEPIQKALIKMNAKPSEALSLGDRDIDILASNAAGVPSVACLWGCENRESLLKTKPTYIISHPSEIITLIKKLGLRSNNS